MTDNGGIVPVKTTHRKRAWAVLVALAVVAASSVAAQPAMAEDPPPLPAEVSVDFGAQEGHLPRFERYNNFANLAAFPQQRSTDVAFLNEQGLHGDIYRVWLTSPNAPQEHNVFNQCDVATDTCEFTSEFHAYMTDATSVSESIMGVFHPTAFVRGQRPIEELGPLVELILRELKAQYPAVRYIEAFNEPDWSYHGLQRRMGQTPNIQPDELYQFYVPFYEAVHEVNQGLAPQDQILLGGPGLMWLDAKWMEPFLDAYAADPNPAKRLDFLSYHAYLMWDDNYQQPTLYKDIGLDVVAGDRALIDGWLSARGLPQDLPSFVTETGIYPGPSFDDPDPTDDYIRQAAGMATFTYLYSQQPNTYMFNWVLRHWSEERKDQLVSRTPDGPLVNTFTPYGNVMLMQSKMKTTRVSATVDAPRDGDNGIYALASRDDSGASVMVWNWQHVDTDRFRTTINMSQVPATGRKVVERLFLVDQHTSNYFTNPEQADLQEVSRRIVVPAATHTVTVDIEPNGIYLVLLEPATPPSKDACKSGGWRDYSDHQGQAFRNQGLCVSWVNGRR